MFIPTYKDATAFTVSPALPIAPTLPTAPALPIETEHTDTEATPSIASPTPLAAPLLEKLANATPHPEHIRHLLFGSPPIVQATIHFLHHLGYANPNDWSRLIPTGQPNEVMAILMKRVTLL